MSDEIKVEAVAAPVEETKVATEAVDMASLIHDPEGPVITVRKLLDAGVYFGHQTRRWNPKMYKYIYGKRNGIYIIDLNKSAEQIAIAYAALKDIVTRGGKVLFVGTKPQAQPIIVEQATRSGSFYINNRWLGGTLTNFRTIQTRIRTLKKYEEMETNGSFDTMKKKEVAQLRKEEEKLKKNLEGIKEMRRTPNAVVVIDPSVEHNAVLEAKKLNIPVFGICSTSDDPESVDYAIPSNNDGTSALNLLITVLADAIVEAKGGITAVAYVKDEAEEATMKDAIKSADAAHERRKATLKAQRQEREDRYKKLQAERAARFAERKAQREAEARGEEAVEEKAEEEKVEEVKEGE